MPQRTYAQRRQALAEQMPVNSLAFLATNKEARRSNDTLYKFRPDSSFFYLTGFNEPESALVLSKDPEGQVSYILFVRAKNPESELWDGKRHGLEGAKALFGADESYAVDSIDELMPKLLHGKDELWCRIADTGFGNTLFSKSMDPWLTACTKIDRGNGVPTKLTDINPVIYEMRMIKSDFEVAQMKTAARISVEAHKKAMRTVKPGMMEYALEGELLSVMQRSGCQVAYQSIVAGGTNACILHYTENNKPLPEGELVLIDAGAEYQYYAADITRTFPINGHFTPAQKQLYELVLEAQLESIKALEVGADCKQYHRAAVRVLTKGLVELGLLSGDVDELIETGGYLKYYMHGTGHWLGMDVHDVGSYKDPHNPAAERKLAAGMVVTVEPGIYVSPDEPMAPAQYRGIGIRIEDDVLITEHGPEVLTAGVPKTVAEVEALVQGL